GDLGVQGSGTGGARGGDGVPGRPLARATAVRGRVADHRGRPGVAGGGDGGRPGPRRPAL
ncbi:MAG: hypothetical protein AVDCRST_MAG61-1234, partial [uncultured Friedmanniella sp.]